MKHSPVSSATTNSNLNDDENISVSKFKHWLNLAHYWFVFV